MFVHPGSPALIVNVASRWGATGKTYKQIASWNTEHGDKLKVLLFPSDEFGGQELPTAEIRPFLEGFKITKELPLDGPVILMDKVEVNGPNSQPVWALAKEAFPGDIAWNFAGIFLFDQSGACIGRFSSKELKECDAAIKALL